MVCVVRQKRNYPVNQITFPIGETKMMSSGEFQTKTTIQHQQRRLFNLTAFTLPSKQKDRIVFHHDNARLHVECRVVEFITNKIRDLFPYPPYSPTEVPTDYYINRSLKNW